MEIELVNASRKIGKSHVLDGVSLAFPAGQVTAVIGKNGAGKTSLLRALVGHLLLDSGELRYGGTSFSREDTGMRRSVMALFEMVVAHRPQETAISFVAATLDAYGVAGRVDDEAYTALLESFGAADLTTRPLAELSRGQRYRFYLAPLFLSGCPTLLIDEPFAAGLDLESTDCLRRQMREHAAEGGTVVYTTPLPELVGGCADRAIVIGDGKIIQEIDAGGGGTFPDLGKTMREGGG